MNGRERVGTLLTAVLGARNTGSEAEAIKANELAHAIARELGNGEVRVSDVDYDQCRACNGTGKAKQ